MSISPRRYVSRARGRALRAAGVPRLPNLPSARALAQQELRSATRVPRATGRGGRRSSADVPATDGPAVRRPTNADPSASPYDDPSRDVGEGPDGLTPIQSFVLLLGVILLVYLCAATCGTAVPPSETGGDHCHAYCQEIER